MEIALLTVLAVCWAFLGTGAITGIIARGARGGRSRDLDAAWRSYASSKRFQFLPATGERPHARSPRLEGRIEDVDLTIEACSLTIGGSSRPCTRIWGLAAIQEHVRVLVTSDARLAQGPGVHDLEPLTVGDAFFDHALAVRASSGEAACRLLGPSLRRALQGLLSSSFDLALVLQLDEGEVSLTWLGEETRPSTLDEACAVVVRACTARLETEAYR
ncbi:MAG TPA: hypothetical protein VIY73_29045 [Polyangiaceae bacterium]